MINIFHRGLDAPTIIMAADDDVRHFQDIDRVLDHGHHGHVRAYHLIGHVPCYKHFSRVEAHNSIGRHSRVGAADPEDLRALPGGHAIKVVLVLLHLLADPPPVVLEDRFELLVRR